MLYIHIPFCKQACHYCDFHFSTNLSQKRELTLAIAKEIELKSNYLVSKSLQSIYFGGGTPSLLTESELNLVFETIHRYFNIEKDAEITLEANPDDINEQNLNLWKSLGINRLSVGIQSFHEPHLQQMNRSHNAKQAKTCIDLAKNHGFSKFSIDLIYGIPAPNHDILKNDLDQILAQNINHISAYCLTIEPKTVFDHWVKKGEFTKATDEFEAQQFEIVLNTLSAGGFEQYEISNFAKNENYAMHNTSYWRGKPYLGIGPSAHSFDGNDRVVNVANNSRYLQRITQNKNYFTVEKLSALEHCNELIMTGLRTKWGVDIGILQEKSNGLFLQNNQKQMDELVANEQLKLTNNIITLTQKGKYLADYISSSLFLV